MLTKISDFDELEQQAKLTLLNGYYRTLRDKEQTNSREMTVARLGLMS